MFSLHKQDANDVQDHQSHSDEVVKSEEQMHTMGGSRVTLPAVLSRGDLVFFGLLVIVAVPNIQAMQFGKGATLFYWLLGFVAFLVPCVYVYGWLMRRAPAHVPLFVWILHFVNERWRSFLLFLLLWAGVLGVFAVVGVGVSLFQSLLPVASQDDFTVQSLLFVSFLFLAMALIALPLRMVRSIWGALALLYMLFFALVGYAAVVGLRSGYTQPGAIPQMVPGQLPGAFSWPLFGLALTALMGLNLVFFFDGELRGQERYLRHSRSFLWWTSLLALLVQVVATVALLLIEPTTLAVQHGSLVQVISLVLGPDAGLVARWLLILGSVGMAQAYMMGLSRALLLGTRLGYVPTSLARLNRFGVPYRVLLFQSALVVAAAVTMFVALPGLLKTFAPTLLFSTLTTTDQFCLFTSVGNSLLALFTALLFLFAAWLFYKKRQTHRKNWLECVLVPGMCCFGLLTSVACFFAPLAPEWSGFFLSPDKWFSQVLLGLAFSCLLAWLISEYLRRSVLMREQRLLFAREKTLRGELQRSYANECELHTRLRSAYDELNHLYQEQERAAITDYVTGLPNHRACIQRLDEELEHCQSNEYSSCLIVFVDLDHFKEINDTWGHQAGDVVLSKVAQRIRAHLSPRDFVGRYGGEEFAVILPDVTIFEARDRVNRLLQVIHKSPYEWCGAGKTPVSIPVTASIGVAAYGVHGIQREELLEQADLAMYQAKVRGRDCVCLADLSMPEGGMEPSSLGSAERRRHWRKDHLVTDDGEKTVVSSQALQALLTVIQTRDHTTYAHSYSLLRMAEEIGCQLGASREDLFLLQLGGLFHDIGKMGIPEAILNKPGPLNEQEWGIMRRHPVLGARILRQIGGGFQWLAPIVLAHHEHWDGHGYPYGLREQEIPLPARILAVLDAYDTMVSRRPYKEPMPTEAARAEIQRCSGKQFDPAVVSAFLDYLGHPGSAHHTCRPIVTEGIQVSGDYDHAS